MDGAEHKKERLGSAVGLCRACIHARSIQHPRGGDAYWRCGLSDSDKRFPKYPRLPVLECPGYTPRDDL